MRKLLFSALLMIVSATCLGVLSPLNQSIKEIETILQHPELQRLIPQDQVILAIEHRNTHYFLITKDLELEVEVIYSPAERPGAQPFQLKFHRLVQSR